MQVNIPVPWILWVWDNNFKNTKEGIPSKYVSGQIGIVIFHQPIFR